MTARLLDLPVPGPVLGMALLILALAVRGGRAPEELDRASSCLLNHLSLLFVPAGVGVMARLDLLESFLPVAVALILGTPLAMAVTALLLQALLPSALREEEAQ